MSRLTVNKPVDEMSMLELAYNSCYAENGKAMYRDFETVKDVRDFVREANVYLLDSVLPADDDEFDERMIDDLQYNPTIYVRGLIALFYRNLWAMADLRERLKAYEDKEEQGLLIELPCKVGDVVYFPIYDYHDSAIIETIRVEENGIFFDWYQLEVGVDCTEVWDNGTFTLEMVGKSVFLTRSEAEEALAKMGGK